ncbi:MAG: sulfite exporter TauE/SafE family protein [Pelomonas sp.]|nr:sulfite exporter TauE/SafE family protein [Roseateles sp.]
MALPTASAGLALVAGALTTLSPCVFPLLPLVLGGAQQRHRAAPLAMGVGLALSFALAGLLLGVAGDALGLTPQRVRVASAWALIAFGVVLLVPALNERFTQWISPLASGANRASDGLAGGARSASAAGALLTALLTGALLGLIWSPCSGPLLGVALTLVATEGGALRGAAILGLFGVGAAVPLVLAAYASRALFERVRRRVLDGGERSKQWLGVLLLLVGLAILGGADKWLEARVNDWLPDSWLNLTTRY